MTPESLMPSSWLKVGSPGSSSVLKLKCAAWAANEPNVQPTAIAVTMRRDMEASLCECLAPQRCRAEAARSHGMHARFGTMLRPVLRLLASIKHATASIPLEFISGLAQEFM